MPAIITKGAFSAQGYGFGASAASAATYIEDVFSTYLYAGNGTSQTITNDINLSTNGGMVWFKDRTNPYDHALFDTVRGRAYGLSSNLSDPQTTSSAGQDLSSFNTNGFTVGTPAYYNSTNKSGDNIVSWTFRKQPKFFDVVTYTGNGSSVQTISHNLGSVPGMIIVKGTSGATDWPVYHRSLANTECLRLNYSNAKITISNFGDTTPTASSFYVGSNNNANGYTYVAYLFAHNAGGFGAAGTDNVISCGSWSGNTTINLGWEPQFVLFKGTNFAGNWYIADNMRGFNVSGYTPLNPNTTAAEPASSGTDIKITSTGFTTTDWTGGTAIYMAIRRGPMKTPTDATKVFSPIVSNSAQGTQLTTGFPVDAQLLFYRTGSVSPEFFDRLRGISTTSTSSGFGLATASTAAEISRTETQNWGNTGFQTSSGWASSSMVYENFARAPGFFDEVCYTGTGAAANFNHNLTVVPELIIFKSRSLTWPWSVYSAPTGADKTLYLNLTDALQNGGPVCPTTPTATTFPLPGVAYTNGSGATYVAYLFATLAGVSKVGSYTGTGAAQNIDCGFAASARFILIKRTDSTGDWYVYDSARGISASNDPYLLLNSTAAEVTTTNYVGTYASGFALTSTAPAGLNASGGSYLFLAIA